MSTCSQLIHTLKNGGYDPALAALYALDGSDRRLEEARARCVRTAEAFAACYGSDAPGAALFTSTAAYCAAA